jgi:hypothetical protein
MEHLDNYRSEHIRNSVSNFINERIVNEIIPLQDPMEIRNLNPPPGSFKLLPCLNETVEKFGRTCISEKPNDTIIFVELRLYCVFWFYRTNDEIFQIIDMGPNDMTVIPMGFVNNN